jgi:hypothetical protein
VQHEHAALVVVELRQRALSTPHQATIGLHALRLLRVLARCRITEPLVAPVRALTVVRRDAHTDAEDPSAMRGALFEVGQLAVHHQEHVLARIGHVGLGHAEAPKQAARERRMRGKQC